MKNRIIILTLSFLITGVVLATPLDIKVKVVQDEIVAGMPLILDIELRNIPSSPVEVPKFEGG